MLQLLSCGLDQLEYPQQIGDAAVAIHARLYVLSATVVQVKLNNNKSEA